MEKQDSVLAAMEELLVTQSKMIQALLRERFEDRERLGKALVRANEDNARLSSELYQKRRKLQDLCEQYPNLVRDNGAVPGA